MGEKLVVGPFNQGIRSDRPAFVIDNDAFPTLINAYQWRGRVKRKRGTSLLGRLRRYFSSASTAYGSITSFNLSGGAGNILTSFNLQANGNIIPGTVSLSALGNVYTDNSLGVLTGVPGGTGTINYATGAITISGGAANPVTAVSFTYYPDLPVMGLEEFKNPDAQYPNNLGFDTVYSYNMLNTSPYQMYDVSFYKNPPATPPTNYTNYVAKTTVTPTSWNGQDYQQFWTVNYQGALWATNGIEDPFDPTNIGMQFKPIVATTVTGGGPPATVNLEITGHGLVVGDFVFVNEVATTTGINFQTGYVTTVTDANNVIVTFPNATIATNGTGGIAQYLTSRSNVTKDCLRWYDGDPTTGAVTPPVLTGGKGWVNFCPPLSQSDYSISDLPADQYYLVGARMVVPFKDRLLFLGPVIQTSTGTPIYLQDTIIYSQNGVPYYTASFTGSVTLSTTTFNPILVPTNQTAAANAFFEDVTGFGGFIQSGFSEEIMTCSSNEDVLIVGFESLQTRLVYSGNDIVPFNFFVINSEMGSDSTFSSVNLDRGVLTRGNNGFIITSQVSAQRFDLDLPDQVFQLKLVNNGANRVCAQRDFIQEWVYFSYPADDFYWSFPTQTLQYNYRDDSWGIFNECYTTYGTFRKQTGYTWATIGQIFPTWGQWNEPWSAGSSTLLQPQVIAGNQQGFVLLRDEGTGEGNSLYIQNISGSTVTSPNHCLNTGDFIIISGVIGTLSSSTNGRIFSVTASSSTPNSFNISPAPSSGTYLGGGVIKRIYRPFIQTKQFPLAWAMARKTRIGAQQYLLSTTSNSQITLLIYLSQNADSAYNTGVIVPEPGSTNNSLVYSTILYTCPESTNLGLTPANTNLQMPTAIQQQQIWHRMNTSLIGDTVQIGFTLADSQLSSLVSSSSGIAITGATAANPCVLTCTGAFSVGQMIQITGVSGMTQLNNNVYYVLSSTPTTVTIDVDASTFDAYTSGGTATVVAPVYQFSEIELFGFILDINPSQLLV